MNTIQFQKKHIYKRNLNPQITLTKDHLIFLKRQQSLNNYSVQSKKCVNLTQNVEPQHKNQQKQNSIEINNLKAEFQKMKTEYQRKINQVEKEKYYYKALAQAYSNQNNEYKKKNHQRINNYDQNQNNECASELQKMQKSLNDFKNQIESKQHYINYLQRQNNQLSDRYNHAKSDNLSLNTVKQLLIRQNSKLKIDLEKIKNQIEFWKELNIKNDQKNQKQHRVNLNILKVPFEMLVSKSNQQDMQTKKNETSAILHYQNPNHHNGHHKNHNDSNEKVKFLQHQFDKANKKIKNLQKLIEQSNSQKITNHLSGLNKKYQRRY